MKEPILVVMAAGIGSRYGGLKQTDPVGTNGELIIDYSVHDAINAGFRKVIFIINRTIEKDFKEIIGNRLEAFIDVDYAYQSLADVPKRIVLSPERVKPLGTAHAVYSTRHLINGPFAVINADDYYGSDAFAKIYDFLSQSSLGDYDYAMIGYHLSNTVTDHGYVSRGICTRNDANSLMDIVERTHIEKRSEGIAFKDTQAQWHSLNEDTIVSMNMWGFTPTLLNQIDDTIADFLAAALKDNPLKCEFYLPYVVDQMIKSNTCNVKVLTTDEKWYGVTYSEDKVAVVSALATMISEGKYPNKLWET